MRSLIFAGGALAALLISHVQGQTTLTASVSVDATTTVRTVDNRMFSVNTAIWDSVLKQPSTLPLLQAADFRGLRFPGGSASDAYDWQTNTDKIQGTHWAVNFDQFAALATALHAASFITVNYGSSTPQDAANWVTYSNVTNKYAIKYWEIGNENYGSWETDTNAVKNDPYTYATRTRDFIAQMKAADPSIKIGVVAVTGEDSYANNSSHPATNPRTGKVHNGWTPVMLTTLKSLGVTPDYLIYHRYERNPFNESDSGLMLAASTWPNDASDLRQQLTDYLGSSGGAVELVCTENNSVSNQPGKQTTSLVNGLYLADSIGNLLQTEFNAMVWWDLRNGQESGNNNASGLYGWRQYGDYGILSGANDPYPTYRAYELLSHFARGGDSVIKVSGALPLLGTFAVRRVDGSLALLVINKYAGNPVSAQFTLNGFTSGATAQTWQYGVAQDTAAQNGNAAAAGVATATMAVSGTGFTATFAPYSATVISLPPPVVAPAIARQPLGQTVASGSTATLSVVASGTSPTYQWSFNGSPLSGATAPTLVIAPATAASAGTYSCAVTNSAGTATTANANLAVSNTTDFGRLINLSVLTQASAAQKVTLGFFTGGGSSGNQPLLLRATGPALANFGVSAFLPDPTLSLIPSGQGVLAANDNWGGSAGNIAAVNAADSATGAFALNDTSSLDAAMVQSLPPGGYSLVVTGNGASAGTALAEVYDNTAAGAFGASSPRLVNLSCLANVPAGGSLTAGFVIGGSTGRTVLIRANGPALSAFSVPSVMPDPQLVLVNTANNNAVVATNAAWQGDAAVASLGGRVGAFSIADPKSKDSALVLTLAPHTTYTATASSVSGAGGNVLIEIYEVP